MCSLTWTTSLWLYCTEGVTSMFIEYDLCNGLCVKEWVIIFSSNLICCGDRILWSRLIGQYFFTDGSLGYHGVGRSETIRDTFVNIRNDNCMLFHILFFRPSVLTNMTSVILDNFNMLIRQNWQLNSCISAFFFLIFVRDPLLDFYLYIIYICQDDGLCITKRVSWE